MLEVALSCLKEIDSLGYIGYIVGGFPRDYYRGILVEDIDICTNMKPDQIQQHFEVITAFEELGSFQILYQGHPLEITTFRKEGRYTDYRRPSNVTFVETLEEDLQRRDFIINTLCIDKNGEYVDLLNAREDLQKKVIQTVGPAEEKLTEDPVRMLRALRFSLDFDFELAEEIVDVIQKKKDLLGKISSYRKELEVSKCKNKEKLVELLQELGLQI